MTDPQVHPTTLIHAAGALVWRGDPAEPEIAVVHRPRYDDWSFPKGKLKPGEHVIAGALREVAEETGFSVALGRHLPPVHYLKGGKLKRVDYWAARVVEQVAQEPSDEVDRLEWLPVEQARARLTYGDWDAGLLRAITAAPLDTTPFLLVRHGNAGARHEWQLDDDLRPLDDTGVAQADTIATILPGYRPATLISSPSRRCVQTLLPYAARRDLRIRTERLLSETEYDAAHSPEAVLTWLDTEGPAAVCGHGKVLPELLATMTERRYDGHVEDTHLRKGALAVLHHRDGRVVAVERYNT
ncbi:NUDIX hydrolase [Sphaerisporangium aureirubrum]|uniref:NUDIX domain-containing protein n=1 Tax=Sphaerisporangium aureirubrum TaxID=1544736 RepID=A0ABW1NUH7_9ACTN